MHESLPRLDFKRCRVAIAADCHGIDIPCPIQLGADYQRSCSRWVTDARIARLRLFFVDVRYFPEDHKVSGQRDLRSARLSSTSRPDQPGAAQYFGCLICPPTE